MTGSATRGPSPALQSASHASPVQSPEGEPALPSPPRYTAFQLLWTAFLYTVAIAGVSAVCVMVLVAWLLPS